MIRHAERLQALQCTRCGRWIEIPREILRDPDKLVDFKGAMKEKHKDCKPKLVY